MGIAKQTNQSDGSLQFERDSQSPGKEDEGAFINFRGDGSLENLLKIKFGYESSGYDYNRDLSIGLNEVVKLRDYLNQIIRYQAMQQKTFYFFSYGSNLLLKRIKKRCDSVEVVEIKKLTGFKLAFNKKSTKDGSGKANLVQTENEKDFVWGAIHRINWHDIENLENCEGLGKGYEYLLLHYEAYSTFEKYPSMKTFVATEEEYFTNNKPYNWYLELTIEGAKENNFPEEYIDFLKSIETKVDEDEHRKLEELSIINDKYASDYNEYLYRNYDKDN